MKGFDFAKQWQSRAIRKLLPSAWFMAIAPNADVFVAPTQGNRRRASGRGRNRKIPAIGPDHKIFVGIGSSCNVCREDAVSRPVRASIHVYNPDGSGGRLFARGLRNAERLAFVPGTKTLWATVNNRDELPYPYQWLALLQANPRLAERLCEDGVRSGRGNEPRRSGGLRHDLPDRSRLAYAFRRASTDFCATDGVSGGVRQRHDYRDAWHLGPSVADHYKVVHLPWIPVTGEPVDPIGGF